MNAALSGFHPDGHGASRAHTGQLGGFAAEQLLRLCEVVRLSPTDATAYAQVLTDALGPVAERPLALPPPARSFLSDDHTPVEFSLAFLPGTTPGLRVLLEPGCGSDDLVENGRIGLGSIRAMADRWGFSTGQLDRLEDLFFPASPEGPLALWCALELRPGGVPRVKVYLNPAANGRDRTADTVREALARLGHRRAFDALPPADTYPFLALDLGDWDAPRAKVYLTHHGLSAAEAGVLPRMTPHPGRPRVEEFFRTAGGFAADGAGRLSGRPALSCHSFTETATGLPSGFTLHVPVRDYVRHDGQARERAVAVLRRHGIDGAWLDRALSAVTSRRLEDGVGLIAYVALVHEGDRPPRVTVYVSSEAYEVRPPLEALPSHEWAGAAL
ncbi:tryptophan dimethylallyltransferase family protein [Streptomyces sp. NEAU-Y11]|uniref:tryptophan dimethylallyltransferase family protein n=1 Tax=Streptomyces cucumeris TaxID=2962890 RepID=UPI0020C90682|nr:tryptophan dimethylallyltransferase family protein [Streptomyces sp. NEAU-Y11]MCP9211307.1 prenyltransferase [Streptomyces sp. NEAU-Y11]